MSHRIRTLPRVLAISIIVTAAFGIGYRLVTQSDLPSLLHLLGYFTMQANIAVLVAMFIGLTKRVGEKMEATFAAIGVYIFITGLVYQLTLAPSIDAKGLDSLVLQINHGTTPLLYLVWFGIRIPRASLRYRIAIRFLIYPAAYGVFGLIEGAVRGQYRYFFLDYGQLGVAGLTLWIAVIGVLMWGVGVGLIALNRRSVIGKRSRSS